MLSLLLLATSCGKEKGEIVRFGATAEALRTDDGSKTYLGHAEQWIFWEPGDKVMAFTGSKSSVCNILDDRIDRDNLASMVYFRSEGELLFDEKNAYVFSPAELNPTGSGDNWTITLPAEQPYRTTDNSTATHPDSSFGQGVLPMISYLADGLNSDTAFFHSLAGIARIQIYSSANTRVQIKDITFKGTSGQYLSGNFTVTHPRDPQPSLTYAGSASAADRSVKITGIDQYIGGASRPNFWTFYLVLPSTKDMYNSSHFPFIDNYVIRMTVRVNDGTKDLYLQKDFAVDIHRCNLTMLPALDLKTFTETEGDAGSVADITLVGNGTKDRPFQIYTAEELDKVRAAFNMSGVVRVNGMRVVGYGDNRAGHEPTYFKIVRSDIRLTTSDIYSGLSADEKKKAVVWTEGIKNFKGIMYFATAAATNGGITNESGKPVFESVSDSGRLERIYVKGSQTISTIPYGTEGFSPLCYSNSGYIVECHNKCAVTTSGAGINRPLAGVCVINEGSMMGCANEALLTTGGNVAGICLRNNPTGSIQGNISLSSAISVGSKIAGICYDNYGRVMNCIVSATVASITATGDWGVVVFNNHSGALVDNCQSSGTVVLTTTGSIGGIVHTNKNNAVVRNCSNQVNLTGAQNFVGGVVATMEGGEVYNCYTEGDIVISGSGSTEFGVKATNVGGIVGLMETGQLYNCYSRAQVIEGGQNNGGIVGEFRTNDHGDLLCDIQNCWSAGSNNFYGKRKEEIDPDNSSITYLPRLGASCYSRVTNEGCGKISSSFYTVDYSVNYVQNPSTSEWEWVVDDTYNNELLSVPLNDWVSNHDSKYREWKQTANNTRPVFN